MHSGCCDACEGQALALRVPGDAFFRCLARDRPSRYGVRFFRRAEAVTPIPTRCRFSCIAYLAPAIAPSSWPSCKSWPSCFRRTSGIARDRPSPYGRHPSLCRARVLAFARLCSGEHKLQMRTCLLLPDGTQAIAIYRVQTSLSL